MSDRDLEHPDITSALRFGYPRSFFEEEHYCKRCGELLPIGYGPWDLCEDCYEETEDEYDV